MEDGGGTTVFDLLSQHNFIITFGPIVENEHLWVCTMEDVRSMTTFTYCSVDHKSGLQRNRFLKSSDVYSFNTSTFAANYVILS